MLNRYKHALYIALFAFSASSVVLLVTIVNVIKLNDKITYYETVIKRTNDIDYWYSMQDADPNGITLKQVFFGNHPPVYGEQIIEYNLYLDKSRIADMLVSIAQADSLETVRNREEIARKLKIDLDCLNDVLDDCKQEEQ